MQNPSLTGLIRNKLGTPATVWTFFALGWLVLGMALRLSVFFKPTAIMRQAGCDALNFGFVGSTAGALAVAIWHSCNRSWRQTADVTYLAAACWSTLVAALVIGQAVVGLAWITHGPPLAMSCAAGVGCIAALLRLKKVL